MRDSSFSFELAQGGAATWDAPVMRSFAEFWHQMRQQGLMEPAQQIIMSVTEDGPILRGADEPFDALLGEMRDTKRAENAITVLVAFDEAKYRPYKKTENFLKTRLRERLLPADEPVGCRVIYWACEDYGSGFWFEKASEALTWKLSRE